MKDAVDAIKQGAADFITKPFQFDALLHVLNSALEQRRLRSENAYLRSQLEQRYRIDGLVGTSRVMRDLYQLLETVAATSSTVLITGETGTGKELAARAIHHSSPRRANRFVAINCSAIPETLLEAELFGHVRGAFTGAVATRQGRLEQAHKGTLFLDEVGTMSPALQAKLLRVLQEREFERVGDSHTIKIDVRVIAATHSDLTRMVGRRHVPRGSVLPPQRDPGEAAAAARAPRRHPAAGAALPPEAVRGSRAPDGDGVAGRVRRLMAYSWPGNVRQLENIVERALTFSQGRPQIDVADLGPEIDDRAGSALSDGPWLPDEGLDFEAYIGGLELAIIRHARQPADAHPRGDPAVGPQADLDQRVRLQDVPARRDVRRPVGAAGELPDRRVRDRAPQPARGHADLVPAPRRGPLPRLAVRPGQLEERREAGVLGLPERSEAHSASERSRSPGPRHRLARARPALTHARPPLQG